MSGELERLEADHRNFRRLMKLFESQIAKLNAGDDPDYEILRDVVRYMTEYPDQFHHPAEDLMFRYLLRRDPTAKELVEAVEKEHEALVPAGNKLLHLLDEILSDAVISRDVVSDAARLYHERLMAHMDREDTTLFPMAARLLAEEDWTALEAEIKRHDDPLFSAKVDQRYKAILEHLELI